MIDVSDSHYITLDSLLIDYLTLTSFDEFWFKYMIDYLVSDEDEFTEIRVRGYQGRTIKMYSGSVFFGSGYQSGRKHFMITFSGQICQQAAEWILKTVWARECTCSRVDFQVTTRMPKNWSQKNLRNRLEKNGERCGFPAPSGECDGIRLETVYIGTREKSDRYYRVYLKPSESDGVLIRFECEIKKRRSREIWSRWKECEEADMSYARYEILRLASKDRMMSKIISGSVNGDVRPSRVRSSTSNTVLWIVRDVIPVIKRCLNAHDYGSQAVVGAIYEALEEYERGVVDDNKES